MNKIGYIVQFYDEDSVSPHGTGKLLYRNFQDALCYAKETARIWMDSHYTPREGPVDFLTPTQENVDNMISGLVFRSMSVLLWIELIYEKLEVVPTQ